MTGIGQGDGPTVIVAAVDGSPTSLRAAAYAAGWARRMQTRLIIVHVTRSPWIEGTVPGTAGAVEEGLDQLVAELHAQVETGAAHFGVPIEFLAARGDPFTESNVNPPTGDSKQTRVTFGAKFGDPASRR